MPAAFRIRLRPARQRACQHQPGRISSADRGCKLGHRHPPVGITPVAIVASFGRRAAGRAQTHTFVPRARNCAANPTIGSTSLRDPHVDNKTRMS
jgi:hypothetical protein